MKQLKKRNIAYLLTTIIISIIIIIFQFNTIINIFKLIDETLIEQDLTTTERYLYKNLDDMKNFGNLLSLRKDLFIAQQNNNNQWIEENIFQTLLHIDGNYILGIINTNDENNIIYVNQKILENIQVELKYKMLEIQSTFNYPYVDYIVYDDTQYQLYLSIISNPYDNQTIDPNFIIILKELDDIFLNELKYLLNIDTQIIINNNFIVNSNFNETDINIISSMNKDVYSTYEKNNGILYQKKEIYNSDNQHIFDIQVKKISSIRVYLLSGLLVLILSLFQICLIILTRLIINYFVILETNKLIKEAQQLYQKEKEKIKDNEKSPRNSNY